MQKRIIASALATGLAGLGLVFVSSGTASAESCGGGYTHCETNVCAEGVFYLNYDPSTDHFSDEYGSKLSQGEQTSIRDEPYRRQGPRGVVGNHAGHWGYYSSTCFPS